MWGLKNVYIFAPALGDRVIVTTVMLRHLKIRLTSSFDILERQQNNTLRSVIELKKENEFGDIQVRGCLRIFTKQR